MKRLSLLALLVALIPVPGAFAQSRTPASQPSSQVAENKTPFGWGDFTWMNGQNRQKSTLLGFFDGAITANLYLDAYYAYSFNHPLDNTLTGSASVGRHNELQVNMAAVGVEWNWKNVIGRLAFQFGNNLTFVQNLDGTAMRGRSLELSALRHIREAAGGYHFDLHHGLNIEAGIFLAYLGLESYLMAENWNYTRSLLSDHTPFYFQGIRTQYFPRDNVKLELWVMNGWQSFGKWNFAPAGGLSWRWNPYESSALMANFYIGSDTRGTPNRIRAHHDNSVLVRYYRHATSMGVSQVAFSINTHFGFEHGGGASLSSAHMIGTSLVHRVWFLRDHLALSLRGEIMSNPSRYVAQYPPPGFTIGVGNDLKVWGFTATLDMLITDFAAVRIEAQYRRSNVPYFAGPGGTTSPDGFQDMVDPTFVPDAVLQQALVVVAVNVRF